MEFLPQLVNPLRFFCVVTFFKDYLLMFLLLLFSI